MTNARDMVHSAGNATSATLLSEQVIPFLLDAAWLLGITNYHGISRLLVRYK